MARIERLIGRGLYQQALECLLVENPFPAVCGRVCYHPCENSCNRAGLDCAVAINGIERFLGDEALHGRIQPTVFRFPPRGKKIAVVGAGPAGLSAAYFLSLLGYGCDVFESRPEPGGVLRWGIPSYRLPEDVPAWEIRRIQSMGVQIHCNASVSADFLEDLCRSYSGVFIGAGHGKSLTMNIPGEPFALDGLDFLAGVKQGELPDVKGPVWVIGGGNTAVDVARTLARSGLGVTIAYRRTRSDMPAFEQEIEPAMAEGVRIMELVSPVRIEKQGGSYRLVLQKMKSTGEKVRGRMGAIPDGTDVFSITAGQVFTAIGAGPADLWIPPLPGDARQIPLSHCTAVVHEIPLVYGGDLTNSRKSIPDAVASGKQAAMVLDLLFTEGKHDIPEKLKAFHVGAGPSLSMEMYIGGERKERSRRVVSYGDINTDYFPPRPRVLKSSEENTAGEDVAVDEARRCFNCGICNDCDNCRVFCPEVAVVKEDGSARRIDMDYCKGCGICVVECPRCAMDLEEEPV